MIETNTERVRVSLQSYLWSLEGVFAPQAGDAFDRWLASVKRAAWDEGHTDACRAIANGTPGLTNPHIRGKS